MGEDKLGIVQSLTNLPFPMRLMDARQSKKSTLPHKFILTDIKLIGIHEYANKQKLRTILDSILREGYRGPAISVFQVGSDDIYNSLEASDEPQQLRSNQYGQFGIADGHNRLAALIILNDLNLLRSAIIPFQLVPGRLMNIVRIGTLNPNEKPLSIEEIEDCFGNRYKVIPPSTSHFQIRLTNNRWARLREGQPDMVISLEDLIDLDEYQKIKARPETFEKGIASFLQNEKIRFDLNQG